jgi:hypothetical protein
MKACLIMLLLFFQGNSLSAQNINTKLRTELLEIYRTDQLYRGELASMGPQSPNFLKLWNEQNAIDSINLKRIKVILDSIGYPGKSMVGEQANEAAFLVIQHANLLSQERYLPLIRIAADHKELPWKDVAKMIDRVAISKGQKQIYGTQLIPKKDPNTGYITNQIEFAPIDDPQHVNQRRKKVGLNTIEEQAKEFGVVYQNIQ